MKKTLAALAAGLALFAVTGAAQAQTKVRIATEGAYLPWNGQDASGKLIGFEIDLAAELCKRMGATCEVIAQDWDGIIPGLQSRKYDVIMAGMSITDERKQVISFAGPYATEPTMFAAMKGSPLLGLNLPTTAVDMATITPEEQAKGVNSKVIAAMTFNGRMEDGSTGKNGSAFADFVRTGSEWARTEAKPVNLSTCAPF